MIAGLEAITARGDHIGGAVANGLSPRQRNVAMIFQSYALYPHLTVGENLGFALRVRREPRELIETRVGETAAMLELEALLQRRPGQLSGGQRQRVAMGRALVRQPAAFLMDEPLSNLDARLRGQMRVEIARLQRAAGVTTVYVTHDQVEAMTMADRVAVMRDGVCSNWARRANFTIGRSICSSPGSSARRRSISCPARCGQPGRALNLSLPARGSFCRPNSSRGAWGSWPTMTARSSSACGPRPPGRPTSRKPRFRAWSHFRKTSARPW